MTIKEVAERTGISADTLRYYERMGLIPPVPRTASGIRNYSEEFIDWITFVQQLKGIGMSLEAIVDYLELARQGNGTNEQRKQILAEARKALLLKLGMLQQLVQRADYQLAHYESGLLLETEELMQSWSA